MQKISDLIRDPMVREAFRRAERDQGHAYAVISYPRRPLLDAGRAKPLPIN